MGWTLFLKNPFKKQYKKMGVERQKRVNDALKELASSKDPRKLGVYKKPM
ncbi:hypothetical protein [Nitrosopumilus sp.]|nr:hypothetical protein [Nitrosopumilus sp.]